MNKALTPTGTVGNSYNCGIGQPTHLRQPIEIQNKSSWARFLHDIFNNGIRDASEVSRHRKVTARVGTMTTRLEHFAVVATATAFLFAAQGAAAGVLRTANGFGSDWGNGLNWSGFNQPDTPTEDANFGVTMTLTTNANIGGVRSSFFGNLFIRDSGVLTLNGITPGGTTPFTTSLLEGRTFVRDNALLVNTGFSDLTVSDLIATGNGRVRNLAGAGGRMTLGNPFRRHRVEGNAQLENTGILTIAAAAVDFSGTTNLLNEGTGILDHGMGEILMYESAEALNRSQHLKTGGGLTILQNAKYENRNIFTQSAGTTEIGRAGSGGLFNGGLFENNGTLNHDGGTTAIAAGGTLVNNSRINQNDGSISVLSGGQLSNDNLLEINGGTVDVSAGGAINGIGITTQNGGTLRVDGEMIQTGFNGFAPHGLTINGGTLEGTGTVRANVANLGGTVGPGNSPGTLTIDGDYTQGPGGTLAMEIESLVSFDILDISGDAMLAGILDLTVDAGYAAAAMDGDTFTIVEWDSFSGAFDTVNGLNFATGKFFTLDYGVAGLTLTVNAETVVAVSEPDMIALFGLGLTGIGFVRRRRR
jgi:hypothetical protein